MTARDGGYEIRIDSHLDSSWLDWFEGLTLSNEPNGEARLILPAGDPSLLHGVLDRIRDLNLSLLAVRQIDHPSEPGRQDLA